MTECPFCIEGYYPSAEAGDAATGAGGLTVDTCVPCLEPVDGATCSETTRHGNASLTHGSTSLATVRIERNYWRLSGRSAKLSRCLEADDGTSSCVGGTDAGDENEYKPQFTGSGYCKAGHTGPLCQVCANNSDHYYFDNERAMECVECPLVSERLLVPLSVIGGLLALVLLALLLRRLCKSRLRGLIAGLTRLVARVRELEIVPRCKLLFTFYQIASQITTVYNVQLTGLSHDLYTNSVPPFPWTSIDWDGYLYPGECIPVGFLFRLLLRALAPLALLIIIPLCVIAFFYWRHIRGLDTHGRWLSDALLVAAPLDLFVSFVLTPTISRGIFSTWDCTKYELDGATGDVRTFLNEDLRIVCGGNDEYGELKGIAYLLLLIWPVGFPLIFLLVLLPSRKALWQSRSTRLVQATAFLHKEYKPAYFWWEVLSLMQRLVLTGWVVFFVKIENDVWRIFFGLLTSIGYLSLIQFVRPYKRSDINTLATAAQFSLVCVFLCGTFIKLFDGDGICDGAEASCANSINDTNVLTIVVIMVAFNLSVLILYVSLTMYQFSTSFALPSVRLVATGQVPELKLEVGQRYHLFLSHLRSSGQDQMTTMKRELQLLLQGVRIFLDVDDGEEIGQLGTYVRQSHSVLFFLSLGYFFSTSCQKEVGATLANGNPIMLLHETDPNRGGAPIEQLIDDCPDYWREDVFVPHRPIIPWLRAKEFKLVSLKMIVSSMLQHQSTIGRPRLQALSENQRPGESEGDKLPFQRPLGGIAAGDDAVRPTSTGPVRPRVRARGHRRSLSDPLAMGGGGGLPDTTCRTPTKTPSHCPTPSRTLSDASSPLSDASSHVGTASSASHATTRRGRGGSAAAADAHKVSDLNTLGSDLYVTGELMQQRLGFPTKTALVVSPDNLGAGRLAQSVIDTFPDVRLEQPGRTSGKRQSLASKLGLRLLAGKGALGRKGRHPCQYGGPDKRKRFFLLYLNQDTWLGAAGSKLAEQVRAARTAGIRVVLTHECDPALGGCEFGHFLQTTPQDLIADGLYARAAVAFHTGQHRAVSLCLLALELGAVRYRILGTVMSDAAKVRGAFEAGRAGSSGYLTRDARLLSLESRYDAASALPYSVSPDTDSAGSRQPVGVSMTEAEHQSRASNVLTLHSLLIAASRRRHTALSSPSSGGGCRLWPALSNGGSRRTEPRNSLLEASALTLR